MFALVHGLAARGQSPVGLERLEVVRADGAALVALGALDRRFEDLVDLVGHGLHEFTIAAVAGRTDNVLDLAADNDDFAGLLLFCGLLFGCHFGSPELSCRWNGIRKVGRRTRISPVLSENSDIVWKLDPLTTRKLPKFGQI